MIKYDFHVRKNIRKKYQFDTSLFTISGDLIIANFRQARILANQINEQRKAENKTDQLIAPGQLNALGLIHEIFHYLIRIYETIENPGVIDRGINHLKSVLGEEEFNKVFLAYIIEFPSVEVFKGNMKPEEYLTGKTEGTPNIKIIFEELLLLHLENFNPATRSLEELFTDKPLSQVTKYINFLDEADKFFLKEKPFSQENLTLLAFLKRPIDNSPHSIEGQLDYMLQKWGVYIYDKFYNRILLSKDLILEDLRLFIRHGDIKPTPPVPVYDADYLRRLRLKLAAGEKLTDEESRYFYSEIEKFTTDIDWMPKVVMIAKNIFVWLDQLSKKYNRSITRLDQIPDEELNTLARWNFNALWLIGIWERSSASRKIKQFTGNPEAAPSAYSLYDYVIAQELGGEESFQNLKSRAAYRGIRLSSDMVPNHTGIYSKWIVEKPDYFLQSDYSPYPNYTFNGPNLSDDMRVEVRIEDKYYSKEDAAVVFQRRDSYTGNIKYIYHGNDGTHMPWNDTAQLNLLKPEVRESLIQTILHVARKFPIIRFDAAMTLAKKHYQRLWFPKPGTGGAIPSRSDYSMTNNMFDQAMPEEFWREVVDRINSEMPETLLLAEAFWLMEGYFVRTLGMHRVYNSAFMHMLMKEENNKYHDLIKNTLDFNPEILKRYVNFMSNPDEETAVNQFGKGDKYFGVAVLLVTMPGLPMFAHGQIEGFSEKYGMEYKKAYYNEMPDDYLIKRHEAEIFPLMQKRYLFSQVNNFEFYDFYDESGNINDNVFAYSNKSGAEKALIIYNNSYYLCKGWINHSAGKVLSESNLNRSIKKIAEALEFKNHYKNFYKLKEHKTKLEFLMSSTRIHESGMFFALNGYEYRVFYDVEEIYDEAGDYERLNNILNGAGVPSIDYSLKEMKLAPFNESLNNLLSMEIISELKNYCFKKVKNQRVSKSKSKKVNEPLLPFTKNKLINFIEETRRTGAIRLNNNDDILDELKNILNRTKTYYNLASNKKSTKINTFKAASKEKAKTNKLIEMDENERETLLIFILLNTVLYISDISGDVYQDDLFEKLLLNKSLFDSLSSLGHNPDNILKEISLLSALLSKSYLLNKKLYLNNNSLEIFISDFLNGKQISEHLMLNEFEGNMYYNKERFEEIITWFFRLYIPTELINAKQKIKIDNLKKEETAELANQNKLSVSINKAENFINKIILASEKAQFKVKELKQNLEKKEVIKRKPIKKVKKSDGLKVKTIKKRKS